MIKEKISNCGDCLFMAVKAERYLPGDDQIGRDVRTCIYMDAIHFNENIGSDNWIPDYGEINPEVIHAACPIKNGGGLLVEVDEKKC
jgi:hypothetical protein